MVLGGAGEKIQRIVDLAEEVYRKVNELREQLTATRETVEDTNGRVVALEREVDEQRALLEAIAEAEGIDVESVGPDESDSE